jgi:hypothetical protein
MIRPYTVNQSINPSQSKSKIPFDQTQNLVFLLCGEPRFYSFSFNLNPFPLVSLVPPRILYSFFQSQQKSKEAVAFEYPHALTGGAINFTTVTTCKRFLVLSFLMFPMSCVHHPCAAQPLGLWLVICFQGGSSATPSDLSHLQCPNDPDPGPSPARYASRFFFLLFRFLFPVTFSSRCDFHQQPPQSKSEPLSSRTSPKKSTKTKALSFFIRVL